MIFNAVDAMPSGGRLTLSAEQQDEKVCVTVEDTGCGMSPEVRSRVFDPFFTTKDQLGMGLGLAVSYGIIRRHEGTFDVESRLGIGSTFRIRLPIPHATEEIVTTQSLFPLPANRVKTTRGNGSLVTLRYG